MTPGPDSSVLVVDAGNLFYKGPKIAEPLRAEAAAKAALIAEAMALGRPDALNVATGDLALGLAWLKEAETKHQLPIYSSNLQCAGEHPFKPGAVISRAGLKIGVIGVTGPSIVAQGCSAEEPVAAVQAAMSTLGAADVWVVLSGQRGTDDSRLLDAVPEIHLLINGEERKEYASPRSTVAGDLLLAAGSRGKKMGVLDVTWSPGADRFRDVGALAALAEKKDGLNRTISELKVKLAEADDTTRSRINHRLAYNEKELAEVNAELEAATANNGPAHTTAHRFVELDASIVDDPATAVLVTALKAELEKGAPVVETLATANGPFVGSTTCIGCHPAPGAQWSTTPHAAAYASLVTNNRHRDSDCYTCHVTGAAHPDGPQSAFAVRGLENVGCESCHGPGRDHAASPTSVPITKTPSPEVCTSCHDGVKDEGRFDLGVYLPKVIHAEPDGPRGAPPPEAPPTDGLKVLGTSKPGDVPDAPATKSSPNPVKPLNKSP